MRTTAQMRELWAPHGDSHNNATFTFWNGTTVRGDRRMLGALTALDRILRKYGYAPKTGETWGYNNRKITGGSAPSLHAYGIAFDINSRANPYGRRLVTDMDRRMIEEIEALRTSRGVRIWRWGGDWNDDNVQNDSSYDAMHFESQASPAELAAGVYAPAGTPDIATQPAPAEEEEVATAFKYGANQLQTFYVTPAGALTQRWYDPRSGWGHKALAQDADPNGEIAVVKDYLDEKGRLDLFVEGTLNEGLVHAWYTGGAWHSEVLA